MPRGITAGSIEASELIAEVEEELRQQETEEESNIFVSVKEMRQFVKTDFPQESVFFSVIMCVLSSERLPNNRGTRVTFVDGFMEPHFKGYSRMLNMMDSFRKAVRVFQLTVWDPKNGAAGKPRFRVGSVYKIKKIHGVKFYHDSLQGSLQAVGHANPGLIEEHGDFEAVKRARADNKISSQRNGGAEDEELKVGEDAGDDEEFMM